MSGFEGLPPECFTFYEGLALENTKAYWQAHKDQWDEHVRTPMRALLEDLDRDFPPLRLYRPNRDLRFSQDKTPYKLFTGATSDAQAVGGVGYFLQVDAAGLTAGSGAMFMSSTELQRFRAAINDDRAGSDFDELVASLGSHGIPVTSGVPEPLKRVPPPFSKQHARSEFLRWKGAATIAEFERAPWMHTSEATAVIRDTWHASAPLMEWLHAHVGQS